MISELGATQKAMADRLAETRHKIEEITARYFLAFGGEEGRKTDAYKQICEQLCLVDGGRVEWTWNYLSQVAHGSMQPSVRFARAIDIYHSQLMKRELMVVVPTSHTFDPTREKIKPLTKPSKPRNYERISIRKDDPARAARSIVDNIPPAMVRELMKNLIMITNG